MKGQKILLLLLILSILCSITVVSASDDINNMDNNLTTSNNEIIQSGNYSSSLKVSDEGDTLGAGEGSFTNLQSEITATAAGQTLELNRNYLYSSSDSLTNGISITKNIIIDGKGAVTIDANNNARIFNIQGSSITVTLRGITFVNALTTSAGGVITSNSNLIIENCVFKDNVALDGGVIYSNGGNIQITNSNFTSNVATRNTNTDGGGGVIYKTTGGSYKITIDNCNFTSNRARSGGVIYTPSSIVLINNSFFHTNEARGGHGGAIYANGNQNNYTILNSIFDSNIARNNNDKKYEDNSIENCGGAIFFQNFNNAQRCVYIGNCNFTNNNATQSGGAIRLEDGIQYVYIYNSLFENNTAFREGGGISQNRKGYYYYLENLTFINCSQTRSTSCGGGAIDLVNVQKGLELINIRMINCTAHDYGGGLLYHGTQVPVGTKYDNLYFENCNAEYKEGGAFAMLLSNLNYIKFNNAVIVNSYSNVHGGAIYWNGPHGTINNITIRNSKAKGSGGAICWTGNYGNIRDINITNSSSGATGGAIYLGGAHSKIYNINMTNTQSSTDGGAIYISADYTDIENVYINNASATKFGGAIHGGTYINGHVIDSTIINSSAYNGGAIYYGGSSGSLFNIDNCTFIKNRASHNGGAIYYIVDDHDGSPVVVYRDYNNFDGQGDNSAGRTSVILKSYSGSSYNNRIHVCYFKDNDDYLLDVSSIASTETLMGIVNISNPNDPDRNSFRVVINVTRGDSLVTQLILSTLSDYNTYFNPTLKKFVINIRDNLIQNTEYNATVSFEDTNYLQKIATTSFKTGDTVLRGDFLILQDLINNAIANGEILDLSRSYVFTAREDHAVIDNPDKSCMNITSPITINGNGFTLDALGYSRIFNITAGNVIFNNVNFVNGNASGKYGDDVLNGGAIYWAGPNGVINNSDLRYNHAEYGGGIYFANVASDCKIDNCQFEANNATARGGAIDCNASKMRLTNTEFSQNLAQYGSALCREKLATEGSGINNIFIKNHAVIAGAALAWMKAESIYIDTYTFIDNTAGYSGGAIYVGEGSTNCVVFNSTFTGNNITNTEGHGGAIEWYAREGNVINSTFINNNAPTGGALYVGSESGNVNITNSGFLRNNALTVGGAIDLTASSVSVNNSYFRENTAIEGGAIFVGGTGEDNLIYHSYFTGNNATAGKGGAVNWNASAGNIYDTNFTKNNALYGGAVYIGGHSSNSRIVGVMFTSNNATHNGGAIDWNATGGQLYNTTFISNYAGEYGAALCRESGATGGLGRSNTFRNNHAEIAGAALAWLNVTEIRINTYYFYDNTAHVSGGAIYIGDGSDNCAVINSIFEGNNVTNDTGGHGGAIDVVANNAEIINTSFTNNNACYGGAVWLGGNSGNTNITNSNFTRNNAIMDGGAINLRASAVTINKTNFIENTAGRNGGGLYVSGTGTTNVIYSSVFERNRAGGNGGAIDWRAAAGHIADSNFTENSADYGGAIYLNGISSHSNITNVIFKGNNATYNGGAIDCNASFMNLTYTKFISNYAGEYGAALCREANATNGSGHHNNFTANHAGISGAALAWLGVKNINIDYYNFINNTAGFSGGAIYAGNGSDNCLINHSYFRGNHIINSTGGFGGAIDIVSNNATIVNSNFTENNAHFGGAIFVGSASGHTNITDVLFTKNSASVDGGAIYLVASGVDLRKAKLYNNTAVNSGGAVFVGGTGTTNIIHDSVFDNNRAGNRGGAIDWLASKGEILNTNFTRNSATTGGALYLNGISSNSILSRLIFANNTATRNGGAIDCNASEVNLTHTKFISNYADYGAALCRESGAVGGFGENNTFIKNHAYTSGAALAWLNVGNIHINNYTFINNTADFSGAAIYVSEGSGNCIVDNSTFTDNFVSNALTGRGGAIDWLGNNGTVVNTTFTRCISANGGGIYVGEKSDNMTVDNVTFTSCDSMTNGGAIVLYGDDVTIIKSKFISSIAMDDGGAIAGFNSNNANISNCYFKYNHAAGHTNPGGVVYGEGGAIYWENSTNLRVSNSQFISNEAHLSGGSISADRCNDSVVYNITTHDETAFRNGGSIAWINSHNVTIDGGKFNDTGANYMGGTIYLSNVDDVTVKNGLINQSYASWDYGGGIYVDGNATIENMAFEDTHSDDEYGTAIYFHSGNSTVRNSKFGNVNNAILVNASAEVHLIKNNLTSDAPNKDMVYLRDDVENIAYIVYYSVWNEGDLYLEGNNFDYVIFNNGIIWTNTTTKMLNNCTYEVEWNNNFTFFANITDDNRNTIISVNSLIASNDVAQDNGKLYGIEFNRITLPCKYQGVFHLMPEDSGLKQNKIYNGTLKVKMPVDLTLDVTYLDSAKEHVKITAKLTPKGSSNYTITHEFVSLWRDNNFVGNATISHDAISWVMATSEWELNNLNAGKYTLTARYAGDDVHYGVFNTTSIDIELRQVWIKVHADNILYGNAVFINITSNANNGTVVISVNGKSRGFVNIINGNANYTLPNMFYSDFLEPGEYTIAVVYTGNEYYGFQNNDSSFIVYKLATDVEIESNLTIEYGDKETVIVTVNEDYAALNASGLVKITINGGEYYKMLDANGKATFKIYELENGTYTDVPVEYGGDKYYNASSSKFSFTVGANESYGMKVYVENITYGQNATIYVTLPRGVTNNVTIYVNKTKYENVTVTDGVAKLVVPNLDAGDYVINTTYNGDEKYAVSCNNGTIFNVAKLNTYTMNVTASDVKVDQNATITVHVPKDANGIVILWVNNTRLTNSTIVDGVATFTLNNIFAGKYEVNATLNDGNYVGQTVYANYYVTKHETPISIDDISAVKIGDYVDITVNAPSGVLSNVTIEIDGVKYNKTVGTDGKAVFTVQILSNGTRTIVASYDGDRKYMSNSTTSKATATRHDSFVNATNATITVGDTVKINITGPSDYNGTASVFVNGTTYSVKLTNGRGQLNITGLGNATHIVYVTLLENNRYSTSNNDSARIYVNRVESTEIHASVENTTDDNPVIIKVTVPEDATGNVTVVIGGINKTVPIAGGENEIIVTDVPAGEYNVTVTYNGDDKYAPVNTTEKLKVSPVNLTDDIKVIDQGNSTVVVIVPGNATGNVTIKIGNDTYNATVINGTAIVNLTNATPGLQNVTVIYSGDDNHTAAEFNSTVNIPKKSTPITIEVTNAHVGDKVKVIVRVPANVTGEVTLEIDGVPYTTMANMGIVEFMIENLTSGNKTVVATYDGDDVYQFNSTTDKFEVFKNNVSISLSIDAGDPTTIKVLDLPSDATGYVIINVNGTEYGINITSSKEIIIPIVKTGTYAVTASYLGDDKYLTNATNDTFHVGKISGNTTIEVENTTVGEPVIVKVTVPGDAEGNITIIIDGNVTKVVNVTGGENVIEIPGVSEGTHQINVTYSGDSQYAPKSFVTNVSVFESIIAEQHIKRGWNSPYDYEAEFLGKDGRPIPYTDVQFIINGKTYTVKTDNEGIAYLTASKLSVGTYDITIINPVTGERVTNKVTIVKRLIENRDMKMDFVDGTRFVVRAIGDDGNPVGEGEFVDIYVNTIHYSCRTDKDGYARLKITLNPAKYTVRSEYKLSKVTNKLVVKQTLKLVKKIIKVKKGKKLVLKAKLKWSNGKAIKGKVIKFKFKGKTYKAKTNSKGIAKVTIKKKIAKKLKKGKKYAYTAKYLTNKVKGKVIVKK